MQDWEHIGPTTFLRLAGRDLSGEEAVLVLGRQLWELLEQGGCRELVVNLEGAEGVGTALVGKFIALHKKAAAAGGKFVVCGLSHQVHGALAEAGLTHFLNVYGTEQEAGVGV